MTMATILPRSASKTPINDNKPETIDEFYDRLSPAGQMLARDRGIVRLDNGRFRKNWTNEEEVLLAIFGEVI
jgi:hypothetical protein